MNTAQAMIAKAASQIGVREGYDSTNGWNNVQPYGTWYAKAINNSAFRAVAWCDIFISWCAEFSGNADIIPKSAWVPGRLSYYRSRKQSGYFPPEPGDIGILFHNGRAVHVFLVEKWLADKGKVQTIEGNTNTTGSPQGNGVYRLQRSDWSTNPNIIYCRPSYAKEAPVKPPTQGGGQSAPIHVPAPKPKPAAAKPIPAPARWTSTPNVLLNDENLRLGKRSTTATYFNPRLWSWLYWQGGDDGRKFCQANYSAWMKESSSVFGPTTLKAMQEAYRILNKRDPKHWPANQTVSPKPTWPGPSFLKVLGFRAD